MGQLQKIESELTDLGIQVVAISPDRPEKLRESLKQHDLSYQLLSDSQMEAARAFGIAFRVGKLTLTKYKTFGIDLEDASGEKHQLLPVPSVFLVDPKGRIQFVYSNPDYTVRIEPEALLAAAKATRP